MRLLAALPLGLLGGTHALRLGLAPAQRLAQRRQVLQAARLDHSSPRSAKDSTAPWPTIR
ncbi:MAG TPA: hypothetical protein PLO41_19675 [Rubrivivax sp.]|nr:hypothetical protein [Rubrivivax sp.]